MSLQSYPHRVSDIPHPFGMENMQLRLILSANLKRAMGEDTQAEVAKRAGIAQSHISRILRCEASATTDLIADLARASQDAAVGTAGRCSSHPASCFGANDPWA
jgi:predicted XRE-type DNA-binding protein